MVEYYLWRAITQSPEFKDLKVQTVLVTEAPLGADLAGAFRWEDFRRKGDPVVCAAPASGCRPASSIRPGPAAAPRDACSPTRIISSSARRSYAWYPFWPGVRYLSILPTNHAIDFMVGFIGPFVCGACVVHLRTLRPEFVRDAFVRYKITYMSLVPMVLKNLERGLQAKFDELLAPQAFRSGALIAMNKFFTGLASRRAVEPGCCWARCTRPSEENCVAMFTGGAFMEPSTLQFFYDLGIPVANGYGLTEAGTALTLNDLQAVSRRHRGQAAAGRGIACAESGLGRHWRSGGARQDGDVALSRRSRTDGRDDRGRLAAYRRPGPLRRQRPSATVRPQEEHDCHRGRQKHLSRGH